MSTGSKDMDKLSRILISIAGIIKEEPEKIEELEQLINKFRKKPKEVNKKQSIDIFRFLSEKGEDGLKKKLGSFQMAELRKIITFHGFYDSKIIRNWKKEHLILSIVDGAISRSEKGKAFMADSEDSFSKSNQEVLDKSENIANEESSENGKATTNESENVATANEESSENGKATTNESENVATVNGESSENGKATTNE